MVELGDHGHLAAEARLNAQAPSLLVFLRRVVLAPAILECALLHSLFVDSLVAKHGVQRSYSHDLHREGKHHEDDEHARDREGLRQSLTSLHFVEFVAE